MEDLRVVHNDNCMPWCGPAALSAVMGTGTKEAKKLIKRNSLRRHLKAVTYSEMQLALMDAGYKTEFKQYPRDAGACPTLKDWAATRDKDGTYIVCVTGHWIAIRGPMWVCSMNQNSRHIDDCPYLKAKVRCVIKVK